MAEENRSGIIGPERAAMLRDALKRKLMERQAAQEKIERVADGTPRSAFGDFAPSFEAVETWTKQPTSGAHQFGAERSLRHNK